jgi:hypothetical protein
MIASLVIAIGAMKPEPTPQHSLRGSASIQIELEDGTTARFTIPSGTFRASVHEITDGPQRLSFLASSPVAAWIWDVTGEIDVDIHLPDPPPPPSVGPFSEEFESAELDPRWSRFGGDLIGPVVDGRILLDAIAPADSWTISNATTRIWQVTDDQFDVAAQFGATVPEHAMQGLHVAGNGWHSRCEIQTRSGQRRAFFVGLPPGGPESMTSTVVAPDVRALRVAWDGTMVVARHSRDGQSWTQFASWRPPTTPTEVGLYAGVSAGAPAGTRFRASGEWFRALAVEPPPPPDDDDDDGEPPPPPPPQDGIFHELPAGLRDLLSELRASQGTQPDWDLVRRSVRGQ